ncbi:MAG: ATP-binding protein [Candidatus Sericytochromatia bacterium]
MISTTQTLQTLAAFLRHNHLRELAEENLRILKALDAPLLRMFAHLPADELQHLSAVGLDKFLRDLEADRALEAAAEALRQWEADTLEGIPRDSVGPSDMVLVGAAQKQAILHFIDRFAPDATTAIALALALDDFYTTTQTESFRVFTRLREEAARRLVRAEAEREAAVAQAEQLQSLIEEMTAQTEELHQQAEELQASQEELGSLYDALKARNAVVEAEVAERTQHLKDREVTLANAQVLGNFGSWEWDVATDTVTWSDQLYRIYGMKRGEQALSFGTFLERLVPEDRAPIQSALEQAVRACAPFGFTERIVRPDGTMRILESTGEVLTDDAGRPRLVRGVCQDVTERKELDERLQAAYAELQAVNEELTMQAEELQAANDELQQQADDLTEQQALTERLIENTPSGIAFLDSELIFRRLNETYAHLVGMSVDQVIDKGLGEVFRGSAGQIEGLMREVMATGAPFRATDFPFTFMRNGVEKLTYWDVTYQPVLDKNDQVGILVLIAEVSDRHERDRLQAEQIAQLQELDRYKDEFLSVISHELRTPLNFITGFASTLADEVQGPLNERQHEAIDKILNGSDRMLMLVDDLLDFAKIQSGRFDLAPQPTAYDGLVAEVLGLLRPLADQKRLIVETDVQVAVPASLDGSRIAQVLTNLLSNAIKFTDAGGCVTVRAFVRDGALVTEVEDTGCGIAPEHHDKLFTHFQQLDMSNTRQAGGTGLGLAISKALVEAHHGRIGLTSEPDRGSTFWFTLPLV